MLNQQAGLGAMMQSSPQPQSGMPASSMAQTMALAKKMSDGQLADVLSGKNMDVPQFVAMTEAMGRKQLRTAMGGMQGAAPQPSEKDKLLAELQPHPQPQMPPQAGLAAVPAPNMENVGMAGGGIIAFKEPTEENNYSSVRDPVGPKTPAATAALTGRNEGMLLPRTPAYSSEPVDDKQYQDSIAVPPNAVSNWWDTHMAGIRQQNKAAAAARGQPLTPSKAELAGVDPTDASEFLNTLKPAGTSTPIAAPALPTQEGFTPETTAAVTTKIPPAPNAGLPASLAAKTNANPAAPMAPAQHPDYYSGMDKDTTESQINQRKEQAQGEFLMQMGAGLLSNPNLAMGLAAGVKAGLPGLAENRKQIDAIQQHQKEYQLNLAKAKEARDNGNDTLAFHYVKQAQDNEYQMGKLAVDRAQLGQSAAQHKATLDYQNKHLDILGKEADAKIEMYKNANKFSDPALTANDNKAFAKALETELAKDPTYNFAGPQEQAKKRSEKMQQMASQYPHSNLLQMDTATNPFGVSSDAIAAELKRRQGQ